MAEKPGTTKDKAADKAAATTEAPKQKRTILTPQQRIEKMEADLKAEREKIQAKAKAKLADADQQVVQAKDRLAKAQAKLDEATALRDALRVEAGEESKDEAPATS